jgi:hypothetical protein
LLTSTSQVSRTITDSGSSTENSGAVMVDAALMSEV